MTNFNKPKPIDSFDGDYAFLSNFYHAPVTVYGKTYLSTESAFQAQKDPSRADEFTNLPPNKAKKLGRKVNLDPDWDEKKDQVMYDVIFAKFTQHTDLKVKLIATGDREIIEGNWWNDTYWGVCKGEGENRLGKLLMELREELVTNEPQKFTQQSN